MVDLYSTTVLGGILAFGMIWAVVNIYNFYPLLRQGVLRLLGQRAVHYAETSLDRPEEEYPTIDILLPAYKEGNVIHQSIGSIRKSDYPQERITVNVLVEPDDAHTRYALEQLETEYEFEEVVIPEEHVQEVVVPDEYPGHPNKPRALDYGFDVSSGDLVGIIDAEDVVAEDLFLKVAATLTDERFDYLQGILDMVNEDDGWRNTLFRGEYGFWYQVLLPAYYDAGYAVPLGGTTNFFQREVLEEISTKRKEQYGPVWTIQERDWLDERGLDGEVPWDPYNVTEDFELGLFLWKEDYNMALIDAVTQEESPLTRMGWIRQRTRWQKGRLYTFLQYLNQPPAGLTTKIHLYFQSALPHMAPVNVAGIVFLLIFANLINYNLFLSAQIVTLIGVFFFLTVLVLHAYGYYKATDRGFPTKYLRTGLNALLMFPYWMYLWAAEFRAIRQIYGQDLSWEKTSHHGRNMPAEG